MALVTFAMIAKANQAVIWRTIINHHGWKIWCKSIESVVFPNTIQKGTSGTIKLRRLPFAKITVLELEPHKSFYCKLDYPFLHIYLSVELRPLGKNVIFGSEIEFKGILSVLDSLFVKRTEKHLSEFVQLLISYSKS